MLQSIDAENKQFSINLSTTWTCLHERVSSRLEIFNKKSPWLNLNAMKLVSTVVSVFSVFLARIRMNSVRQRNPAGQFWEMREFAYLQPPDPWHFRTVSHSLLAGAEWYPEDSEQDFVEDWTFTGTSQTHDPLWNPINGMSVYHFHFQSP